MHWSSFSSLLEFLSWPFHLLLATFAELFINQHHWSDVVCHITLVKTHIGMHWSDSALYTTHHHNISFTDYLNIININFLLVLGPEISVLYAGSPQDISVSSPWLYFFLLRDTIEHLQCSLFARGIHMSDQQDTISRICLSLRLRPGTIVLWYFLLVTPDWRDSIF